MEISLSQDSCYASDEAPVTSATHTTAAASAVSSFMSAAASSLPPFLNSILKKPYAVREVDSESESCYGSDTSDYQTDISIVDSDAFSEEDEDDGDDLYYYVPSWDKTSKKMESRTEAEKSVDDFFIGFESMVRFDSNVHYIDPPEFQEEEDATPEMTFHEMMEMARASGNLRVFEGVDPKGHDGSGIDSDIVDGLEEHTRDIIDLDKRLFIAYMNGMNGISDRCRSRLRRRVSDIKGGRRRSPFMESEGTTGVYLDQVLHHVIGVFRNLLVREEFDELVALREEKVALKRQTESSHKAVQSCTRGLLNRIEHLLSERLAKGNVDVGQDEMSFLAGGVLYALENWSVYTYD